MDPTIQEQELQRQAALAAARNSALTAGSQNTPANTKKAYKKPLEDWEVGSPNASQVGW